GDLVRAVLNLALLTGNVGRQGGGVFPLFPGGNAQGAADMGCSPYILPGHRRLRSEEDRAAVEALWGSLPPRPEGKGVPQMLASMEDGTLKAAVVMADGVAPTVAGLGDIAAALGKTEFLVVSTPFESDLTATADVVLPATTYAEETGTVTNLERRVQLLRPCRVAAGEERAGWETLAALARRLGAKGFDFASAAAVFEEVRMLVPAYGGLTHRRLERGGVQWPCPDEDHPGTPTLYASGEGAAKPAFSRLAPRLPIEAGDADLPFLLAPGRVLHDPRREVRIVRTGHMNRAEREDSVEVHPEDADCLGINEGDRIEVSGPDLHEPIAGAARLTSPQPGLVGVTRLFATVASDMQESNSPDPVLTLGGLLFCRVKLAKVRASTGAGATAG
ncbi:MAG: molybdopterin-dependent oxidoreductase, partial [Gemmatimonadetes bacterium]|nr:molybdopterin-dependent oxidoreductase [Gemmatimonadota bacterium]